MNKRISFFCITILLFSTALFGQKSTSTYIDTYKDLADSLETAYQIPSEVILGIAMHESGAGTSKLAKKFYNHFGIKGSNQNSMKKLGYKSSYKEYQSVADSYIHFCNVVAKKKFYASLKGNVDYKKWISSLRKSGYAAAQDWEIKVNQTINKYRWYFADPLNTSQQKKKI